MIKEELRHHQINVVVLSTYAAYYSDYYAHDTSCLHQALDDIPFDSVRLEMMTQFLPKIFDDIDDIAEFSFPFLKFHSRWDSLEAESFSRRDDYLKGFAVSYNCEPYDEPEKNRQAVKMTSRTKKYFQKIVDLCRENHVTLLLLRTPVAGDQDRILVTRQNYCIQLASSMGIDTIDADILSDQIGLDYQTDFLDEAHVNTPEAEKITSCVGRYLSQKFNLKDHRYEPAADEWNADYEKYLQTLAQKSGHKDKGAAAE